MSYDTSTYSELFRHRGVLDNVNMKTSVYIYWTEGLDSRIYDVLNETIVDYSLRSTPSVDPIHHLFRYYHSYLYY